MVAMRHKPDLTRLRRHLPFRLVRDGWWLPFDPDHRSDERTWQNLELIP